MQKNTARYFAQCLQEVSTLHIIEICIGEFEQGTDEMTGETPAVRSDKQTWLYPI